MAYASNKPAKTKKKVVAKDVDGFIGALWDEAEAKKPVKKAGATLKKRPPPKRGQA